MQLAMVTGRRPVCIDREATILAAGRLMREQHTEHLVVTETVDGKAMPAAVVSARDIVTRVLGVELDPSVVTVGDIVWARRRAVHIEEDIPGILAYMCATDGEILPVVDSSGGAVGVVSMEDLLQALAGSDHHGNRSLHRR